MSCVHVCFSPSRPIPALQNSGQNPAGACGHHRIGSSARSPGRPTAFATACRSPCVYPLIVCGTWFGVRRAELERAASEARNTDLEDRLRDLILTTRNESVAAAERAEVAAVRALRSNLCALESQAANAEVEAATTARAYLALLEGEGLTLSPGDSPAGSDQEEPLA